MLTAPDRVFCSRQEYERLWRYMSYVKRVMHRSKLDDESRADLVAAVFWLDIAQRIIRPDDSGEPGAPRL